MYQNKFKKATLEEREAIKMLTEEGESAEVKKLVTDFYYNPVQPLKARYEYVKTSFQEKNFNFFEKIANLLGEEFAYSVRDSDDEWECCVYHGNNAYDFELILSLARFYQKNETLFDGHFDIIKRMCKLEIYGSRWEKVKEFWLKNTIYQ